MSGIFAVRKIRDVENARRCAAALSRRMKFFPWQSVGCYQSGDSDLFLGLRVNEPSHLDSHHHQAGHLTCVVEGYLVRSLEDCGAETSIQAGQYAQAVISAYRKYGTACAEKLEGPFTALLHDADRGVLLACNGRFACSPLYHRQDTDGFVYATQLMPLAACGAFAPEPNPTAIAHVMTYNQALGTETLVAGVQAMETATIRVHGLANDSCESRRYWSFGALGEHRRDRSFKAHVDDVCDVMAAAGRRMTERQGRYISGLSGGLDSRLVTALAAAHVPDLKAWTYVAPDSSDMVVSSLICSKLGVDHLTFETQPELIPRYAESTALCFDGCVRVDFAFAMKRAATLREQGDIVLNGLAGDAILGGSMLGPRYGLLKKKVMRTFKPDPRGIQHLLSANRSNETIAGYVEDLYGRPTRLATVSSTPPESLREIVCGYLESRSSYLPLPFRAEQWIFDNRVARWTIMGIASDRHFYSDGSVFYDYEVLERCLSTPHEIRQEHHLFSGVLARLLPDMAAIVNGNNGLSPVMSPAGLRWNRVVKEVKKRLGRSKAAVSTGCKPGDWARTVCRDYLFDLINDPRTLGRSFWDGDQILAMLQRHDKGVIEAGTELAVVASIEHFFRALDEG